MLIEPNNIESNPKLTQKDLEDHLWAVSDLLRGNIDATDYKQYIFGLLFLKRMNDVFSEPNNNHSKPQHESQPHLNQLIIEIPEQARWHQVLKFTENIGNQLDLAMQSVENQNPHLRGILTCITFSDKNKLSDKVLRSLIKHFNKLDLRNKNLEDPDVLGRAYEYLLKQFADDAGKKGGEFYTPASIVKLIVKLLDPRENQKICDPTAGSGGFLIHSIKYFRDRGDNLNSLQIFGQEKNLITWAICKMNLILHGYYNARVERGDTLRDPKLVENGQLLLFDIVMANPPFSLKKWGTKEAEQDTYNRFQFGIPPNNFGDLAFLQHMIATTTDQGKIGVVMPMGILFRGGKEKKIRQELIENDLIECIIGLTHNLFYGASIPACILIINKAKPQSRKNHIIIVDASQEYEEKRTQNILTPKNIQNIFHAYKSESDQTDLSIKISIDNIRNNDYNLNIALYKTREEEKVIDLDDVISTINKLRKKDQILVHKLNTFLDEFGIQLDE